MKTVMIYTMKVMKRLVEKGHIPIATIPNPKDVRYNSWVFEVNEALQKDLDEILKEVSKK